MVVVVVVVVMQTTYNDKHANTVKQDLHVALLLQIALTGAPKKTSLSPLQNVHLGMWIIVPQ